MPFDISSIKEKINTDTHDLDKLVGVYSNKRDLQPAFTASQDPKNKTHSNFVGDNVS